MDITRRTVAFELRDTADAGDGLTIAGYATTFNDPYQVTDWQGTFLEQFSRGAFRDSIAAGLPRMQFNHGQDPALGALPVGVWTRTREDKQGLWMEGRINNNWLTEPLRQAIESGGVTGMSIAFSVNAETWTKGDTLRTISSASLAEAGPVVYPANPKTTVSVRARDLVALLHDPDVRAEVARMLTMPTPDPAADADTGEDGASTPDAATTPTVEDEPRSTPTSNELALRRLAMNRRHAQLLTILEEIRRHG